MGRKRIIKDGQKASIYIPVTWMQAIDELAKEDMTSRNTIFRRALKQLLGGE